MGAVPRVDTVKAGRSSLPDRYINASEVGSYVFCKRSWHLGLLGTASTLEAERARGTAYHHQHGDRVRAAAQASRISTWCAILAVAIIAFVLWLLWW
jgi:hypothetical protein